MLTGKKLRSLRPRGLNNSNWMHRQKAGIMRLRGGKRREGCSFSQDNYPLFWYWFRCKHCICSQKICYFAMLNCAIRLPGNVFWICICGRGGKCRRGGGREEGTPSRGARGYFSSMSTTTAACPLLLLLLLLLLLNVHHHHWLPSLPLTSYYAATIHPSPVL